MTKDPYQVLGVSATAAPDEIKSAYRKKAKEYHPDLHPDDPSAAEKMNELNEAYDILSDPERLAAYKAGAYDQGGFGPSQASSFSGWNPYTGPSYGGGPSGFGNGGDNGRYQEGKYQNGSYRTYRDGYGNYYRTYTWTSDGSGSNAGSTGGSDHRQSYRTYRSYRSPLGIILRSVFRIWLWTSLIRLGFRLLFGFFWY